MKNKNLNLKIAIMACFMALIAIFTFVPYVGFIPLGFISVTVIHVVVIIGAMLLNKNYGALLGLFMGISSMIKSMTTGTMGDQTFIMPWVSILPRVLFGYLAGLIYEKMHLKSNYLNAFLTAMFSTIIHTLLVFVVYLPTFVFMYGDGNFFKDFTGTIGGINTTLPLTIYCFVTFMFSCLFETLLSVIVIPPVILVLKRNSMIKRITNNVKEEN